HWEPEEHIRNMEFKSAVETAVKTVDLLKHLEKPDYIICVYHGGFERDLVTNAPTENLTGENEGSAILNQVPGIDVLITGHQHVAYAGTRNGIVYTQTHDKAAQLACVDIYPDTGVIEPRLLEADTEPDPEILAIAQEEEDACQV
ncbi:MAG: bifunctional metallophosphatase/5'-nucleotidase, partial [Solobacterium sp.]|nr:bifunctional metallophosphatase/5'-nucleotidase [Solobacterium sp.]